MILNYLGLCMVVVLISAAPEPRVNFEIDVTTDVKTASWNLIGNVSVEEEITADTCPHSTFEKKHVCPKCASANDAKDYCNEHRNDPDVEDDATTNTVFKGDEIKKYIEAAYPWAKESGNQKSCLLDKPVTAWTCYRDKPNTDWKYCEVSSAGTKSAGHHTQANPGHLFPESLRFWSGDCSKSAHPWFTMNHVCEGCIDSAGALAFVTKRYGNPRIRDQYKDDEYNDVHVFAKGSGTNKLAYEELVYNGKSTCSIKPERAAKTWQCKTDSQNRWKECNELTGSYIARGRMGDGKLIFLGLKPSNN